jgi:hypothetical protein
MCKLSVMERSHVISVTLGLEDNVGNFLAGKQGALVVLAWLLAVVSAVL